METDKPFPVRGEASNWQDILRLEKKVRIGNPALVVISIPHGAPGEGLLPLRKNKPSVFPADHKM